MNSAPSEGLPFTVMRDGVRLAIRLTPKAAAERIAGAVADGHGGWQLKIGVTAPPVDGKANAALVKLLAKHLRLAPRDLVVASGMSDRSKLIEIRGDPAKLVPRIKEGLSPWLKPA